MTAKEAIAAYLSWGLHGLPSEDADSLLKRLAHEGYAVIPVADIREVRMTLTTLPARVVRDQLAAWEEQQQTQFAGKVG